jgi:hypothetical protein
MQRQRPIGISIISGALGMLGASTLLAFLVGLVRGFAPESWFLVLVVLVYAAFALAASRAIWRLSPQAPSLFLTWCASFFAFAAGLAQQLPDVRGSIGLGAATGVFVFWASARYIRRACVAAA